MFEIRYGFRTVDEWMHHSKHFFFWNGEGQTRLSRWTFMQTVTENIKFVKCVHLRSLVAQHFAGGRVTALHLIWINRHSLQCKIKWTHFCFHWQICDRPSTDGQFSFEILGFLKRIEVFYLSFHAVAHQICSFCSRIEQLLFNIVR